jgi:hypothetical protein
MTKEDRHAKQVPHPSRVYRSKERSNIAHSIRETSETQRCMLIESIGFFLKKKKREYYLCFSQMAELI